MFTLRLQMDKCIILLLDGSRIRETRSRTRETH